jgi:hypothetical protein
MRETLDQDHSLSLSDPDRSLVLSHFLTNFLQNLASCHTALTLYSILFWSTTVHHYDCHICVPKLYYHLCIFKKNCFNFQFVIGGVEGKISSIPSSVSLNYLNM